MKTTLPSESVAIIVRALQKANARLAARYPGESGQRQPVSVLYGGAHLFKSDTPQKLGALARRMANLYLPDARAWERCFGIENSHAENVAARLLDKLRREPLEDLRIDFEDGYGFRPAAEEDTHALAAAEQTALAMSADSLPPFFGIRIKPLNAELTNRSLRTLDIYLTTLCEKTAGRLPANFVITLPKVMCAEQAGALAEICAKLEAALGWPDKSLRLELMVETPQSLINEAGEVPLSKMIAAADGRCRGVHFGAFDYTAACGITASYQDIRHSSCDFARAVMQAACAGTGVWLSDGVTTMLPLEIHRGEARTDAERQENANAIHRAWRLHYDNIRHSLESGFYQSWDLHPAQLIPRYVATYAFFLEGLDVATKRLRNFLDQAAQATTVGNVFDDAATGQGLLNYFLRAVHCGALDAAAAQAMTGLTLEELRAASFVQILQNRQK